jgi:TolA-binding protein
MRAKIGLPPTAVVEDKARRFKWLTWAPWGLAVAAAALTIGFFTQTDPQPPAPIPTTVAKAEPIPRIPVTPAAVRLPLASLVWRGEETNAPDPYPAALAKALEPYRANNYASAIDALQDVAAKFPRRAEGHFYLGVSLLLAGRDGEALTQLEAARSSGDSPIAPEIDWYRAAALRNLGRNQEAEPSLQSLCSAEGIHQKEACSVLSGK